MENFWGFDHASPGALGWTSGGNLQQWSSNKRTGTHSMACSGVDIVSPSLGGNFASLYAGAAVYYNYMQQRAVLSFYDGTTAQISLTIETDGSVKIRRGDGGGTVLASSSAGLFTAGAWHHLQLYASFHGSTGAVEARVNSVTAASASGANTSNSGNAYASVLRFGLPSGNPEGFVDDVWVNDSAFRGDCSVETVYPSADGTTNNFTASAGSRYQCVDETGGHNSDTDYVSSSNLNDIQLFAMGNLTATTGTVHGVKIAHASRKDDAGARSVARVVRSGGSNSIGSDQALTTSYVVYNEVMTQDPTDMAAWTIAKVNALEAGVKITV